GRARPVHRPADRGTDDHRFAQWGVDHPVLAELREQPVGGEEHAALQADVLAKEDHGLVAPHLLGHRLADGLDERLERHQSTAPSAADVSPSWPSNPWPPPKPHAGGVPPAQPSANTHFIAPLWHGTAAT